MSKSPNLGLTLTPPSESLKRFIDFRTELTGDGSDSNMMILDKEVGRLKEAFTWGRLKNGTTDDKP